MKIPEGLKVALGAYACFSAVFIVMIGFIAGLSDGGYRDACESPARRIEVVVWTRQLGCLTADAIRWLGRPL